MTDEIEAGVLPRTRALLASEIGRGFETGAQVCVSLDGQRHELALGDDGSGAPMTLETVMPWTCSSKPIGGIAYAMAWAEYGVALGDRIADYLPEFAQSGKEAVTVRHVLTHTTGVSDLAVVLELLRHPATAWDELQERLWEVLCATAAETPPGLGMLYNTMGNWFVLDRLLTSLWGAGQGESYRRVLRAVGAASSTLGITDDECSGGRVTLHATGEAERRELDGIELLLRRPLPGVSTWGPMRDLASIGEVLLRRGRVADGELLREPEADAIVSTHWPGSPDDSDWDDQAYGLGVMTGAHMFGRHCSPATYGHGGSNNCMLMADPEVGIVIAAFWNGRVNGRRALARHWAIVRSVYGDLGLRRESVSANLRPSAGEATERSQVD